MATNHDISIYIDGIMLTEENSNVYSLDIEESFVLEIPKLNLFVALSGPFLVNVPILDGSLIEIRFNNHLSKKGTEVWLFKVFHFDAMGSGQGTSIEYRITAYHKSLWDLSCLEDESYNSNSSDVFKRIADKTNMLSSVDETLDKQVWFTLEGNRLNFLRDVCRHAYANKYSTYVWWVSKNNTLHFKNIISRIQEKPSARIQETNDTVNVSGDYVPVTNVTYAIESGTNNFYFGYGNNALYYDALKENNNLLYPREFMINAGKVNVNADAKNQGWLDFGINTGNTHANYELAAIQNKRSLALWSTIVTCIDTFLFPMEVGDCVQFNFKLDGITDFKLYSGRYLIAGIKLAIDSRNSPVNKLTLIRQGVS